MPDPPAPLVVKEEVPVVVTPPIVEPPKPPEPLKLPSPITFATGTSSFTASADVGLNHVLEYLKKSPEVAVMRIEGHTDDRGVKSSNQRLSEDRALAVAKWLVGHGVECKRLSPFGYGDTDPVADNGSEEGRAQNRRTVFVDNTSGHPGGRPAGDPCAR